MYASDLIETEDAFRIDIRHCDRSPGLNARKVWEVLFRNTGIKDAPNYDSFLCDLRIFERAFESRTPVVYWEYSPSGYTDARFFGMGDFDTAYRIELIDDEIVITKPSHS